MAGGIKPPVVFGKDAGNVDGQNDQNQNAQARDGYATGPAARRQNVYGAPAQSPTADCRWRRAGSYGNSHGGCDADGGRPACPFRDADAGWRRVCVVGSGPSAAQTSLAPLTRWGWRIIVVNDAWRLCTHADVLYACDRPWWEHHHEEIAANFEGERWTQDARAAERFGLKRIAGKPGSGLSFDPARILYNQNSGAQAVNLAVLWGAQDIALVGIDGGPTRSGEYFFGTHPKKLHRPSPYATFIRNWRAIAGDAKRAGVRITNCSLQSKVDAFPKKTVEEVVTCPPRSSCCGTTRTTAGMPFTPDCDDMVTA